MKKALKSSANELSYYKAPKSRNNMESLAKVKTASSLHGSRKDHLLDQTVATESRLYTMHENADEDFY